LNRHFFKEDIKMASKYMKRSLITREMPIRATMRYDLIPIRVTIIYFFKAKRKENTSLVRLHTAGGNEKWCSCFGKQYGSSSKKYTKTTV
jgi:hypothetical protein